jgi:hypothetical protein
MLRDQDEKHRLKREEMKAQLRRRYNEEVGHLKISVHEILDRNRELERNVELLRFVISLLYMNQEESGFIDKPPNNVLTVFKELEEDSNSDLGIMEAQSDLIIEEEQEPALALAEPPKSTTKISKQLCGNLEDIKSNIEKTTHFMKNTLKNIDMKEQLTIGDEEPDQDLQRVIEGILLKAHAEDPSEAEDREEDKKVTFREETKALEELIRGEYDNHKRLSLIRLY